MSTTVKGECCVCGKEAKERCSACGKAGFNLFFCSAEHQKLVWFAHKQVCGPNSRPFSSPPLSVQEVEQAKAGLLTTSPTYSGKIYTLQELLIYHMSIWPAENRLSPPEVLEFLHEPQSEYNYLRLDLRNSLLSQVRAGLHALNMRVFPVSVAASGHAAARQDLPSTAFLPYNVTARFQSILSVSLTKHALLPFPVDAVWYIELQHLALVHAALRYVEHQEFLRLFNAGSSASSARLDELHGYSSRATERLLDLLNRLRITNPPAGEALDQAFHALYHGLSVEDRERFESIRQGMDSTA